MHNRRHDAHFFRRRPGLPRLARPARCQRDAAAWADFEAAPPGYRKVVLHWITQAKREETRSKRRAQLI
ncbi:MAG: hypothetical protein EOO78_02460 [Oxalobacteraceae bacterium]|nr:MAG: hypothetical protein EOO78_02460 [Oxalobacteraceae bacterium]